MPRHRGLVTYLTTWRMVLLGALIASALLAAGAGGETVRSGNLQVSFGGSVAPQVLPRTGRTPISVAIRGYVRSLSGGPPPSLRRIAIEVNRLGVLDRRGLPTCPVGQLRAASTGAALEACGDAQVSRLQAASYQLDAHWFSGVKRASVKLDAKGHLVAFEAVNGLTRVS